MKKLVILDFDGTLVDSSPGILYCMNTTAMTIGYSPVAHEALYNVVGQPLSDVFRNLFNMTEDEIEYATNNYSKMYSQKGKEMFTVYDGITDVLKTLKSQGIKLAISTQKHKMFVSDMLKMIELTDMFDMVSASDVDKNLTISESRISVCDKLNVSVEDSVLIGDSDIEANAAQSIGMDFIAAFYGWGFKYLESDKKASYSVGVNSVSDITARLLP